MLKVLQAALLKADFIQKTKQGVAHAVAPCFLFVKERFT